MQTLFLWFAAASSIVTFCVHTFVGGVFVARPLLADTGLPAASKWLNYFCWHVMTILLLAFGGAYAYSAIAPDRPELAVFATGLAAVFSVLSAAVAIKGGIHPLRFPSTSLLAAIACLGGVGLLLA